VVFALSYKCSVWTLLLINSLRWPVKIAAVEIVVENLLQNPIQSIA